MRSPSAGRIDSVTRPKVDRQPRHASTNGFDVTKIAAYEAFNPGLHLSLGPQITQILKPMDDPALSSGLQQ